MQKKNLKRSVRRHYRERAIQHAFNVYWFHWYGHTANDAYSYNSWQHDKVLLENNEARFEHQDEHRKNVLNKATKKAKHLRYCSCKMCSYYKEYKKNLEQMCELEKDADEIYSFEEDSKE